MIKKLSGNQYQQQSSIFKTYRKIRETNTYKSQIFPLKENSNTSVVIKNSNKTFQHTQIFNNQSTNNSVSKTRTSNTYKHTNIFPAGTSDPPMQKINSADNSLLYIKGQSLSITPRQKRIQDAQSDIFGSTSKKENNPNYEKLNTSDMYPIKWSNSQIYPGNPSKVNENANFNLNFSREMKIKANQGVLSPFNYTNRERGCKSEHQSDGNFIIPSTIPWNAFDSLSYRRVRLRTNENESLPSSKEPSNCHQKMMKEKQSSMDSHNFYDKVKPKERGKGSSEKIQAFLNGKIREIQKDDIKQKLKIPNSGAISNNLYGIKEKSPSLSKKEPDVLRFEVKSVNGKFEDIKQYCHDKGYGLVKMEEHQDIVTYESKGTASIVLRVKKFLNDDYRELDSFFKQRGMNCHLDITPLTERKETVPMDCLKMRKEKIVKTRQN